MKSTWSRTAAAGAAVVALGIATAACGSNSPSTATSPAASPPGSTTAASGSGAPAAGAATLKAVKTDLGTILVDGSGFTLYMFVPDAQGPSTCKDQCAANWPSLAGPATAGDGVDQSKLGTAKRPDDGSAQVTYAGWPLYRYAADTAAGATNGQGSNGKWYVVGADGTPIGMTASTTTTAAASRGGYGY